MLRATLVVSESTLLLLQCCCWLLGAEARGMGMTSMARTLVLTQAAAGELACSCCCCRGCMMIRPRPARTVRPCCMHRQVQTAAAC